MDRSTVMEHISSFLKKYRYVILILLAGLVLMLLPERQESQQQSDTETVVTHVTQPELQEELAKILSKIEGAGRVEVLLSKAAGEQTLYQSDSDQSTASDSSDTSTKTVIVTNENRAEQPLIRQVLPPVYQGAVVVCDGGDIPAVQLAVVSAVSSATGLSADKITVLKMK